MLWILAFSAFGVGVQAEFFPRSFYDDFPFGRGWVAMDGRYNEHLIRDFGALNLALLVLTIGAIVVGTRAISADHGRSPGSCIRRRTSCTTCGISRWSMPGVDKVGIIVVAVGAGHRRDRHAVRPGARSRPRRSTSASRAGAPQT